MLPLTICQALLDNLHSCRYRRGTHRAMASRSPLVRALLALDTWQPRALAALAAALFVALAQDGFLMVLVKDSKLRVYACIDVAFLRACASVLTSGALAHSS